MPFSTIITTANMASRASEGLPDSVYMKALIITTSIPVTDRVRMTVPTGSPSLVARASAWWMAEKADVMIASSSQANRAISWNGRSKSLSH